MGLMKRIQARLQEARRKRAEAFKYQKEVAEKMKAERKLAYEEEMMAIARQQGKNFAKRQTTRSWTIKSPDLWGDARRKKESDKNS